MTPVAGSAADPPLQERVTRAATDAAAAVPGVAQLRPGLADLVRTRAAELLRAGAGGGGAPLPSGIRVRRERAPDGWRVQVRLAVEHGRQALGVARAVRTAVADAVRAELGPGAGSTPVSVTVTVADLV